MTRALAALAVVLGMSLGLAACEKLGGAPSPFKGIDITGSDVKPGDTALVDSSGQPRTMNAFGGKVLLVMFGYTHCPDVCPTSLADAAKALKQLGNDASRVQVVFVGVDPSRDTPALLGEYVKAFRPDFIGLTGNRDAITRVTKDFRVYAAVHEDADPSKYTVEHAGQMFVLDGQGRPRLMFPPGMAPADIASDLRVLLDNA
jgi:protein SCO1/2